jgi:hypothetical protein
MRLPGISSAAPSGWSPFHPGRSIREWREALKRRLGQRLWRDGWGSGESER